MCPSIGRASAATASGYGFDGPGPSSSRSEIGIRGAYARHIPDSALVGVP